MVSVYFAILGAVLGSFANVCMWRLPRGESVAWPPSHCPLCSKKLKPWHMVPVISWIILRGKCHFCGGPISIRYPIVELSSALLFGSIGYYWGLSFQAIVYCVLSLCLIISIGTDLSHREIPDQVSLGSAVILGVFSLVTRNWSSLLGGAILFSILFLIALASRGGMGGGDIKLALPIGFALGWQLGLVALAVSFLVGGIMAGFLMLLGKRGKMVPFGPFLAFGAWVAMFWGWRIVELYWNFSLCLWRW